MLSELGEHVNFSDVENRDSDAVVTALTRKCEVCRAKPGSDCRNTVSAEPLPFRVVHLARATA